MACTSSVAQHTLDTGGLQLYATSILHSRKKRLLTHLDTDASLLCVVPEMIVNADN